MKEHLATEVLISSLVLPFTLIVDPGCGRENPRTVDKAPTPATWEMVWYDEFDGNAIDPSK